MSWTAYKRTVFFLILGLLLLGVAYLGILSTSNPWKAARLGEIPAPLGFERIEADGFSSFLRDLPVKKRGSKVHLYTGGLARYQFLSLGVIDWPLLSNSEQCADVTMRVRAEYLWSTGQGAKITFSDVNGKKHPYKGGKERKAFEQYLKASYERSNTASVYHETLPRAFKDVRPGDPYSEKPDEAMVRLVYLKWRRRCRTPHPIHLPQGRTQALSVSGSQKQP